MASETKPKFPPKIDLSKNSGNLKRGSEEWKLLCHNVRTSLEDHGYLIVKYDQMSDENKKDIFAAVKSLMALPAETKLKNASDTPYFTYIPPSPQLPYIEALAAMNFQLQEKALAFTELMWPDGNDVFCQAVNSTSKHMLQLAQMLLDVILDSYGVHDCKDFHADNMDTLFRMTKYTAPMSNEQSSGLTPHVDRALLTLLFDNEVEGLLLKSKDGNWFQVKPGKGSLVLFVGQTLRAWSNGRLHAPLHKVTISGEKDRFICALFWLPKPDRLVEAHSTFVDDEHPPLFKPFVYGEFLRHPRASEEANDELHAFAGI